MRLKKKMAWLLSFVMVIVAVMSGKSSAEAEPVQLNSIDDSYWIKFTVRSAGLSIRLNGDDVTNQGWNEGNTVPVTEVNEKEYRFELYQSNNGNDEPGGGNGEPQCGNQ